jgi:hypothetical protein
VLSNAKVDEFVAMVEHARKIYQEGETNDTPTRKQKWEEEKIDSDYSPAFKRKMQRVDENMRKAPPQVSQRMEIRAQAAARCLEFELANLNAHVVHEIGKTSSAAIMEIGDSEWLEKWKPWWSIWHNFDCIVFWSVCGVVLQCLELDFKYTIANILHVDASIVGMLWPR